MVKKDADPVCGFSKTSTRYRVPGPGYLAPGSRDRISAEGRTPSTEDRARPLENAHTGYAGSRTGARTRSIARLPYCHIARPPYLQMTIAYGGKTVNECGRQVGGRGELPKNPNGPCKTGPSGIPPKFPIFEGDAYPVCALGPVLGARYPALGVDPNPVPGIGSQVPGTLARLPDCLIARLPYCLS